MPGGAGSRGGHGAAPIKAALALRLEIPVLSRSTLVVSCVVLTGFSGSLEMEILHNEQSSTGGGLEWKNAHALGQNRHMAASARLSFLNEIFCWSGSVWPCIILSPMSLPLPLAHLLDALSQIGRVNGWAWLNLAAQDDKR